MIKPEFRGNEALGLIRGGLRDFSVSRTSLDWGIPLPWDERHVAYVWFDALTNYLSATGFGDPSVDYTNRWPVDYHLIGKDIIRHHCVYWPAMLMSAGVDLPKGWAVGGWLLVDGEKMAKSTGNVVNPLDLIDVVGVDGFRYYVLAETSYGSDGDFSFEGLVGRYNSDLANNLGNLAARVATVVGKKCDGVGPAPGQTPPLQKPPRMPSQVPHPDGMLLLLHGLSMPPGVSSRQRTPISKQMSHGNPSQAQKSMLSWVTPSKHCELSPSLRARLFLRPANSSGNAGLSGSVTDQRIPSDVEWGGYTGGAPVEKGTPLFPRIAS